VVDAHRHSRFGWIKHGVKEAVTFMPNAELSAQAVMLGGRRVNFWLWQLEVG
jgi:hypothetical protein